MPTASTLSRLRRIRREAEAAAVELARRDALLARLREYLGDGHAGAPIAAAFVSEINRVLGTET